MKDEVATMVEGAASREQIAKLEGELKRAADEEEETARRLHSERKRRASLDRRLYEARVDATRLMLEEASQTRNAIVAEAEELLQATRVEAEREADQVTKQAFDKANEMIAIARRKAIAIVDAGREEVREALEGDPARRMAGLDTEHRELTHRLGVMETICDELVATLNLVAEIATEELAETKDSVKQLDPRETEQPPPGPKSEQTTSGSAPQGELRDSEQANADRFIYEARAEARDQDQLEPLPGSVPEADADGREEPAVIIDDRDLQPRRSRYQRWLRLKREDRVYKENRARHVEAVSKRFSRVLSSGNSVEGADPEEVEARLRNLSHGTNGK